AIDVIRALSRYPDVAWSVRLLTLQSMLFAGLLWALLYGGLREAVWASRDRDVRLIGHGPRLAAVYPEAPVVRLFRSALLVAAGVTALAWLLATRARFGVVDLGGVRRAILATLHFSGLQWEVLRN